MNKIKIFIDTNFYLDFVLKRDNGIAKLLLDTFIAKKIDLFISDISIVNIHFVAKKSKTMDKETIFKILENILYTHKVVTAKTEIIFNAIKLTNENIFKDFEDCIQYLCAKETNADIIITNNKKDFKNSSIIVLTPLEFFERYKDFF